MDSEYKKDNSKAEAPMEGAVYSTGYFLLKHKIAYPKENVLTFYSLYRHTAKLGDYKLLPIRQNPEIKIKLSVFPF